MDTLTCEARTGFYPGEFSSMPLWFNAAIGLRSWVDSAGRTHRACRHHVDELMRRNPRAAQDIARQEIEDEGRITVERRHERTGFDPDGIHGPTPCTLAGHIDGCPGKAGGDHELRPGWIGYDEDGHRIEVEVP